MPRHTLPVNAVEAFLAAARHLNLTHAAAELCLTQGAVSRKIATLEAWFGFPLFQRHARGLRLSPQGSALYPELLAAFNQLHGAAEHARQQQTVVRLKAPTCAIRWLLPRLSQIEQPPSTRSTSAPSRSTPPWCSARTSRRAICCSKRR